MTRTCEVNFRGLQDHSGARRERRTSIALAALFAMVAALTGFDLALDLRHGIELGHAIAEGAVMLVGLSGAFWMLSRLRVLSDQAVRLSRRAQTLEADLLVSRAALVASTADAERWRTEVGDLVAGLGAAIDRQLQRWDLSQAEQEVALLLLKGLSHKEIADIRGTGEATVRQQSTAIYRKAGLGGRHDLAAFFLEDLLGPRDATPN
ncbi:MAG: helix-turn-helix transcriptional regulator [Candidatus Binatia bacterium]